MLIALSIGSIIIGGFLALTLSGSRALKRDLERTNSLYSAIGGIEILLERAYRGEDLLKAKPPEVKLNGYYVKLEVKEPEVKPQPSRRYINPHVGKLSPGEMRIVKIFGVEPYSPIVVNWDFEPEGEWEITLGEKKAHGDSSPAHVIFTPKKNIETLVFINRGKGEIKSSSFREGGRDGTWISARLTGKNYILISEAGRVRIEALISQIPGPNPFPQKIVIEKWEESTPPKPPSR